MTDWGEHYKALFERASHERDWYKAHLFDAWKTMRGQAKGLQRQRRLIKRLQAENARLRNNMEWVRTMAAADKSPEVQK